jgi:long-chain acyl-CoA synthetase
MSQRASSPPVWVFDVDGTILDSLTGSSLRPGTADLFRALRSAGARVLLWSAGGAEYARTRAAEQSLEHLVDGFHDKEARDDDGRYVVAFLEAPLEAVYVDDRPEDLPLGASVIAVSPYLAHNPFDRTWSTAVTATRHGGLMSAPSVERGEGRASRR